MTAGLRYVERLNQIADLYGVDELASIRAFDFHPLSGPRRGQHAIRLTGRMRLIVTVEDPEVITVIEVVDYHG